MIEVRTVADDEVVAYSRAMAAGFGFHMSDDDIERRRPHMDLDRTHAAFDEEDGSIVGTARSFATALTVPGGSVAAGAATNVTVMPTHRRRGILTAMMRAQLDDVAARSEPVAILIASEATIYGRFGYGPATWNVTVEVDTARGRFAAVPGDAHRLRMCSAQDMRAAVPPLYERFRTGQPGAIGRGDWVWDVGFGIVETAGNVEQRKAFHVLHPDGWLSYVLEDRWEERHARTTLKVLELVALTPEAYAALWRHVIGHDLVVKVVAPERPDAEPLPWLLTDPRRVRQSGRSDFLWVRLLDVPAALSARTYSSDDRLVLEVVDGMRGSGRYELDGSAGVCRPTTDEADLTTTIAVLGAAYLGGTPLWPAAAAGEVVEHTPGALQRADRMFATTVPPWCNTWF